MLKKQLKDTRYLLKQKENSLNDLQVLLNEKNSKIAALETENVRLKLMVDQFNHVKRISDVLPLEVIEAEAAKNNRCVKVGQDLIKSKVSKEKCIYENRGSCKDGENCSYVHP